MNIPISVYSQILQSALSINQLVDVESYDQSIRSDFLHLWGAISPFDRNQMLQIESVFIAARLFDVACTDPTKEALSLLQQDARQMLSLLTDITTQEGIIPDERQIRDLETLLGSIIFARNTIADLEQFVEHVPF